MARKLNGQIEKTYSELNTFLEDRYDEVFGGNMGVNMGGLVHALDDTYYCGKKRRRW